MVLEAERRWSIAATALGIALASASGQGASLPQVRHLGPVIARTTTPLQEVGAVRVLSDGRILVNDPTSHRVLLFDSTLAGSRTIVGSPGTSVPENAASPVALLASRGDSSLLINGPTKIDVIDPSGKVVRSIPLPPRGPASPDFLAASIRVTGDRQGRLLYIPPAPFFLSLLPPGFVGDTVVSGPEFVPLLRFDPATLRTDTVATLRAPRRRQALTRWESGGRGVPAQDPFPLIGDDWTVLADGTVAIARLRGYSTDWIAPNGTLTSGPAVPHLWTPISSANKLAMIDSMRLAQNAAHADSVFPRDSAKYDSLALVAKANPEAITDGSGKRVSLGPRPVRLQFVAPTDLPDSMPAFAPAGMVADSDGNLWIQNYSPARPGGGIVYDVVNKKGALIDRVELPPQTSLLAFMPEFAFLRVGDNKGAAIAKVRVRSNP
jgi:hypothetical protein